MKVTCMSFYSKFYRKEGWVIVEIQYPHVCTDVLMVLLLATTLPRFRYF